MLEQIRLKLLVPQNHTPISLPSTNITMQSSLLHVALQTNQAITRVLCPYTSVLYYDNPTKKFCCGKPGLIWKVLNFGLMTYLGILMVPLILYDALSHPGKYSTFRIFWLTLQFIYSVSIFSFSWVLFSHGHDFVLSLNAIHSYMGSSNSPGYFRIYWKASQVAPIKMVFGSKNKLKNNSGKLDLIGGSALFISVSMSAISVLLPGLCLYQNLDCPYYILEYILPVDSRSFLVSVVFFLARCFVVTSLIVEGITTMRTLGVAGISLFHHIEQIIKWLSAMPQPCLLKWRRFRVAFFPGVLPLSWLVAINLAMIFLLEVLCITASVVAIGTLPWYEYGYFPLVTCVAGVVLMIMFYEMVSCYRESYFLRQKWVHYCGGREARSRNQRDMSLLFRTLKSMQPISIRYGSLGTITTETRTSYYYGVLEYSINAILACRS